MARGGSRPRSRTPPLHHHGPSTPATPSAQERHQRARAQAQRGRGAVYVREGWRDRGARRAGRRRPQARSRARRTRRGRRPPPSSLQLNLVCARRRARRGSARRGGVGRVCVLRRGAGGGERKRGRERGRRGSARRALAATSTPPTPSRVLGCRRALHQGGSRAVLVLPNSSLPAPGRSGRLRRAAHVCAVLGADPQLCAPVLRARDGEGLPGVWSVGSRGPGFKQCGARKQVPHTCATLT